MELRKQTVWLLTMLAVMVVLSGYYLVKGPNDNTPALTEQQQKKEEPLSGVTVETKPSEPDAQQAQSVKGGTSPEASAEAQTGAPQAGETAAWGDSASEVFQGYKMKRDAMLQKEKDEQMSIMMNPDATPQSIAEAKARHEELSTIEQGTMTLEEMLKAGGYKDAVVSVQKDKVTVIVQKEKLAANEVVDIIAQVKQHLHVQGKNVSVQFKSS